MSLISVHYIFLLFSILLHISSLHAETNPNDLKILNDFRKGLKNAEILKWPENGDDPCGPPSWPYVVCSRGRVTHIQMKNLGLQGTLPSTIGNLTSLQDLNLSGNQLVGFIPTSLARMKLQTLVLSNNMFIGPIPEFKAAKVSYDSNFFCQTKPGLQCASDVNALLDFLNYLNYPLYLITTWVGNDPCGEAWPGVTCNTTEVLRINLAREDLNGSLSPSLGKLTSLLEIRVSGNNLTGKVPSSFTKLKYLRLLDLSYNNFQPTLPKFHDGVEVIIEGNPLLVNQPPSPHIVSTPPPSPSNPQPKNSNRFKTVIPIFAGVAVFVFVAALGIFLFICCYLKKKKKKENASLDSSISVEVLRKATNNFSSENELGRGGFGSVYKGQLEDGTKIAVKRMECGTTSSKGIHEFQAEIDVLSKVRHRNLVSLLGYSIEGNQRLLAYEYMPLGDLSRHLFHWKSLNLDPLSWSQRLAIALDIARGMEYLHSLAQQTFIHRDLKPANVLLGDDIRAKVSDFGLVKLAPDGDKSMATKLAGTFGYLAPEYAVTGKITTKVDVYSYGVILIELLTGLVAIDESRSEENRSLAQWFGRIKSSKERLMAMIDPSLELTEETVKSILTVAELAGHCTSWEVNHRPYMGHAVKVLSDIVEKWQPVDEKFNSSCGIDVGQSLLQMLKIWNEEDGEGPSGTNKEDGSPSSTSIENMDESIQPYDIADSFTSSELSFSVYTDQ